MSKEDNPALKSTKVLIVESDDEKFSKLEAIYKKKGLQCFRGTTYQESLSLIARIVFRHVVCEYKLTDSECFDFIGKLKEVDYHHQNLIISTKDVVDQEESKVEFANFIQTEDIQSKLDEILDGDFDTIDFSNINAEQESYIRFSDKNKLEVEKTYLFDLNKENLYIGYKGEKKIGEFGEVLYLDASFSGNTHEIKLNGSFQPTEAFDEDKDSLHLIFKVAESSKSEWDQILDEYEADDMEVVDLLMNVRGY
jgi:hypothetical protein